MSFDTNHNQTVGDFHRVNESQNVVATRVSVQIVSNKSDTKRPWVPLQREYFSRAFSTWTDHKMSIRKMNTFHVDHRNGIERGQSNSVYSQTAFHKLLHFQSMQCTEMVSNEAVGVVSESVNLENVGDILGDHIGEWHCGQIDGEIECQSTYRPIIGISLCDQRVVANFRRFQNRNDIQQLFK